MTIKLFKRLSKISIMQIMSYRKTTIIMFFVMFLFFILEILSGFVFYTYTDNILGFTMWDYYNLIITANIILMLHNTLFIKGYQEVYHSILYGKLDHVLTKPVNSFWFMAFNGIDIQSLINLIIFISIQIYLFLFQKIQVIYIFPYILLIMLGAWYTFIINYFLVIITFYTDKASSLLEYTDLLFTIGQKPRFMYPKIIRIFLTFIFPYLMVYNAPIELLQGKLNYKLLIIYIIITIITTLILYKIWFISIKRYRSTN